MIHYLSDGNYAKFTNILQKRIVLFLGVLNQFRCQSSLTFFFEKCVQILRFSCSGGVNSDDIKDLRPVMRSSEGPLLICT